MSRLFTIAFSGLEIEQLLMLLNLQTVIADENANRLIQKIKDILYTANSDESGLSAPSNLADPMPVTPAFAGETSRENSLEFLDQQRKEVYRITFEPADLEQLLKVLYLQTSILDEQAINLIAKINRAVHQGSLFRTSSQDLLSNKNLDLASIGATETYYQYREKRLFPALPQEESYTVPAANPLSTIAKTLESIAQTLEAIVPHLTQPRVNQPHLLPPHPQSLGFTNHYHKDIVYCQFKQGSYWHLLNEWQQPIAIHGRALTCIVQALDIVEDIAEARVEREAAEPKLHLHVQADKLYCLEVPSKGLFTIKLLMAIVKLSPQQLQLPITIEPVQLTNSQELTCQVYYQGNLIPEPSDIPPPLPQLIKQVQVKLQQASTGHF